MRARPSVSPAAGPSSLLVFPAAPRGSCQPPPPPPQRLPALQSRSGCERAVPSAELARPCREASMNPPSPAAVGRPSQCQPQSSRSLRLPASVRQEWDSPSATRGVTGAGMASASAAAAPYQRAVTAPLARRDISELIHRLQLVLLHLRRCGVQDASVDTAEAEAAATDAVAGAAVGQGPAVLRPRLPQPPAPLSAGALGPHPRWDTQPATPPASVLAGLPLAVPTFPAAAASTARAARAPSSVARGVASFGGHADCPELHGARVVGCSLSAGAGSSTPPAAWSPGRGGVTMVGPSLAGGDFWGHPGGGPLTSLRGSPLPRRTCSGDAPLAL